MRRRLLLAALGILSVILMSAVYRQSSSDPVSLLFMGYTNDASGKRLGIFCMSNQTSRQIHYIGDGPSLPSYGLMWEPPTGDPMVGMITNLRSGFRYSPTKLCLEPHAGVVFLVELPVGIYGRTVTVSYERSAFYSWFMSRKGDLSEESIEFYDSAEISEPFWTENAHDK